MTPQQYQSTILGVLASVIAGAIYPAQAQELEPRAYTNTPIGVNFLSLGYAWSNGNILLDPALPIENLDGDIHVGFFQASHAFSLGGDHAKARVSIPWSAGDWQGSIDGETSTQKEQGMGDAWLGFDWLFSGAPALTQTDFPGYRPAKVFGMGLRLSVPTGDYDRHELLNLGSNRWTLRSELSAAQTWDRWTFEGVTGVRVIGDNTDFLGSRKLEQKPLLAIKGSVIYSLSRAGSWTSFSIAYGEGGQTRVDGVSKNTKQRNWRFGASFSLPLADKHGISVRLNSGANNGAGSNFDSVMLVYTYQGTKKAEKR